MFSLLSRFALSVYWREKAGFYAKTVSKTDLGVDLPEKAYMHVLMSFDCKMNAGIASGTYHLLAFSSTFSCLIFGLVPKC